MSEYLLANNLERYDVTLVRRMRENREATAIMLYRAVHNDPGYMSGRLRFLLWGLS